MRLAPLMVLPIFLAGCAFDVHPTGPLQRETKVIERDNAERVAADIRMGIGELHVTGGSKKLLEGSFSYNIARWKPDIRYNFTGVRGHLTVEQPHTETNLGGNQENRWDLQLNNEVPLDLNIDFGVGEARLDLGMLDLRSLEVKGGVGEIRLDLRGTPKRDLDVRIRGGVGEATVRLPEDVGVYADATGGIGGVKVRGLRKEGSHYINDAYETNKVKIRLDVRGGIGGINLIAE